MVRLAMHKGFTATTVDQGTEFVSRDLDLWAHPRGVALDFSRTGKPADKAFIEAFNGRFRAGHWFLIPDAQKTLKDRRKYHNEERPHGTIGNKTPVSLPNHVGVTSPP